MFNVCLKSSPITFFIAQASNIAQKKFSTRNELMNITFQQFSGISIIRDMKGIKRYSCLFG